MVLVYDVARDAVVVRGKLGANVCALAWSRDGKHLAVAGTNTEIRTWDVP
jgi:hypothetical protein